MDKINKILNFEIKQIGEESDRTLRFVGSDETPDRDNDIMEVNGWKLEEYLKNPVFLWAHQYDELPVGKAINVTVDNMSKKLLFDIQFPTAEEYPFADTIFKLYKGGYLNATSVGFSGMKYEVRNDDAVSALPEWQRGRRYKEQALLELSAVPVPANPNALVTIRSKGISDIDIDKIFTEELKEVDLLIDTNSKTVFISENGIKTAKVKIDDQYLEKLLDPIEKAGAAISSKNRAMLNEICENMKGCGDRLRKFIDTSGMIDDDEIPEKNTGIIEIKEALVDLKFQVLSLCPKDANKVEFDLAAIEFVKSAEPPDELDINPDEFRKILSEKFNTFNKEEN